MGVFLLRPLGRGEKVSAVGEVVDGVVDGVVLVVLGFEAPRGPDVKRLRLPEAGPWFSSGSGGGSSFGLEGGFLVLVGGFCLLEDVDNVLALLSQRVSVLAVEAIHAAANAGAHSRYSKYTIQYTLHTYYAAT